MKKLWLMPFAALVVLPFVLTSPGVAQDIMPTPTPTPSPTAYATPVTPTSVTASTNDGNVPANATDGNLSTRWSGYGDGAFLEYDLGATTKLVNFKLAVYHGDTRRNNFEIRTSIDRKTWTTVVTGQSLLTVALLPYELPDHDARYVRYVGHGYTPVSGAGGLWNSVMELVIQSSQTTMIPSAQNLGAATIQDAGAIYVHWMPPANGASSYKVYRSPTTGGPYQFLSFAGTTTYQDNGLANGAHYCYVVTVTNGVQESRYSNESCASATVLPTPTPTPFPSPSTPTGLVAQNGAQDCSGTITPLSLTWNASTNVAGYWVFRGPHGGPYTQIDTVGTPSWSTSTVMSGYFVVQAQNPHGVSGYSNELFATFAVPSCPTMDITPPATGVSASTNDGNVPANAVDNNLGTRWSGYGDGAWLRFDLGSTRSVSVVRVAVYHGTERKNTFDIQSSVDGTTWATLRSVTTTGATSASVPYDVPRTTARYVRLVGHGNVANDTGAVNPWNSFTEVDLFGF
jgi:hypothetical protein